MQKRIRCLIRSAAEDERGETIVETLAAVLIVSMAMTMLAGAIMTSSRINSSTKNMKTEFKTTDVITKNSSINIKHLNGQPDSEIAVDLYITNDKNKYVYYEKH